MGDTNVSEPLEQGFSRDGVESLLKVYEAAIGFRRLMSCLLNDGSEGKDEINGLMTGPESFLSPSSKVFTLKLRMVRQKFLGE
jgi:hypothetical protein